MNTTPEDAEMQKIWNDPEYIKIDKSIQSYISSIPREDLFKIYYALTSSIGAGIIPRIIFEDKLLKSINKI